MGKVIVDITTSLDGYIAGPNDGPEQGLGEGGEKLHEWVFGLKSWREPHGLEGGETNEDSAIIEEAFSSAGAIVVGKRMFDNAAGWGDEPPFHMPVFVLTHEAREPEEKQGGTTFTFVNDGSRARSTRHGLPRATRTSTSAAARTRSSSSSRQGSSTSFRSTSRRCCSAVVSAYSTSRRSGRSGWRECGWSTRPPSRTFATAS